jgi:hypothetical protein
MCIINCYFYQVWCKLTLVFIFTTSAHGADQIRSEANTPKPTLSPEESLVSLRDRLTSVRSTLIKKATDAPAPPEKTEPLDLLAMSTIIHSGGNITLVPKEAIIYIPKEYESRLGQDPTASILNWNEFLPLNRGWISCLEINYNQAVGKEPLPTAAIEKMKKYGNLIVATLSGNPITVCSQKPKDVSSVTSKLQPLEK